MSTHPFDRELTGVRLARHLGEAHGYHSSNELENFEATHRQLHGVPSASEERRQAELAQAWFEGYEAAEKDAENRPYSDRPEAAEWLPTRNPYVPAVEPVSTGNPELWRT